MKPIRLSRHAMEYVPVRGFIPAEVEEAIRTCAWGPAELGRMDCRYNLPYAQDWNGKFYAIRQIRPVFVEEDSEIVVITVYTYYF